MTFQPLWPAEHVTELRRLIEVENMSSTEAAAALSGQFKADYSRNSVIGKCKRECIKLVGGNGGGRTGPKGDPSTRKVRPKAATPQRPVNAILTAPKLGASPYEPAIDPMALGTVALLDLSPNGCRWPSGDGPFLFCDAPRQWDDSPYCVAHHDIAHRVDQRRG